MPEGESDAFDEWFEVHGRQIESEINTNIQELSANLSVNDGSHAVWHDGQLGMLLVLPFEHAMAFAAESLVNDFETSPMHNYVFSTITQLIMRATDMIGSDGWGESYSGSEE